MAKKKYEKTADEAIVEEAHKRFERCEDRESESRRLWKEDLRFANADPDNGWQWEDAMRKQRETNKQVCLTINKVKQHNRQITNDARQNKPAIRVLPVDSGSDKKTAEIFNGIIRHIEANSGADTAYDTASEFAVDAGLGYWRITTDYAADDTSDQEIFIKRVKNPLSVYISEIQEADGSDMRYGFLFDDMPKEDFERKYPDCDFGLSWGPMAGGWMDKDTIRVCEYFRVVDKPDMLVHGPDGNTFKLSEIDDPEMVKAIKADPSIQKRKLSKRTVEWYLLAGDKILERNVWLGKYIPIVRVVGDEIEIDGKVHRTSHTRPMKDAQRMYNYWTTSAVEYVALQGKQPYIGDMAAFAGHEKYWNNLNTSNLPWIPFNGTDEETGNPIQAPQRQQPPVMAQAYMSGMQIASDEMKAASGQEDPQFGKNVGQQSGRAINALQRKGDNATFHFVDNVARAIRYTGQILVDLIPKVYDTPRIVRILGEDGKEDKIQIDPEQQQAMVKHEDPRTGAIKEIYNPSVGRYDVVVAVGPSYGTKRQEAAESMVLMSQANPQMWQTHGDLIAAAQDWPMADEFAKRFEKTLPPGLKDDDKGKEVDPQVEQLTQQVQQMDQVIEKMSEELEGKDIEREKLDIDRYNAETNRLKVVGVGMTEEQVQAIVMQTLQDALSQQEPPQDDRDHMMPDGEMMPDDEMPPPDEYQPQDQPADAGFLTPQDDQGFQP